MIVYKVIKHFTDLLDSNRPYNVGDTFPHKGCGYPVTEKRLAELASKNNKQGVPLIESVEEAPKKPAKRAKKTAEK